jgi:hypothetical protein
MQPLAVLTGILLGSVASIAFGLAVSVLVSVVVAPDAPQLAAELGALWRHTLLFAGLTVLCAAAFIGLLRRRPWRWYAQAAMWIGLAGAVLVYLPR